MSSSLVRAASRRACWPSLASAVTAVPSRGVTDIQYYKETDQSHLHIKEAESHKRKFLLKLAAREKKLNERAKAKEEGQEVASAAQGPEEVEDIQVPEYIERGPADMLR